MMLQQLSLFLENKPGHLSSACRTLGEFGIDILTLSLADTQQFGILRLIVQDPVAAKAKLETVGYTVRLTEVVAVEIEDRPGGLADLLTLLNDKGLNVEYMYAFSYRSHGRALMIFRFDDTKMGCDVLIASGAKVLPENEVLTLIRN
ncbi:MAG: hypothetical protein PHE53_07200 [Thermoguttaceae bacterium]|nr:hypothetical protein [Thermoguttaceae bacterium]